MPAIRWFFKNIAFIGALLMVAGTVIAEMTPALLSVGCVFIIIHPLVNNGIAGTFRAVKDNAFAWPLLLYYLLILVTFFYTNNTFEYGLYIQRQLPLVFLGVGLALPGIFTKRQLNIIFATLVLVVLIAGIASFVNYMLHFDEINESITHSKPIPIVTKVNHIHYSLLLAFSLLVLLYQLIVVGIANKTYKAAAISVFVVLFLLLHTIAARTGLAAFYIALFVGIIWYMAMKRKLWFAIMSLSGLCILGVLAVSLIPSLKTRYENTKYDLQRYSNGEDPNNYSISERFESTKNAFRLWQRHPLVGVAPADLKDQVYKQYEMDNTQLQGDNRTLPHNQFLLTATCMGIIGFAVLLAMFLLPLFNRDTRHCILFMLFLVLCFVAFQVESVLERQVGISFFCLFYMILSTQLRSRTLSPPEA